MIFFPGPWWSENFRHPSSIIPMEMPVARRPAFFFGMNEPTLTKVAAELANSITGKRVGRIHTLGGARFVIEFRNGSPARVFVSAEPNSPRTYLVERQTRELERLAVAENVFAAALRRELSGARIMSVDKIEGDRVIIFGLRSSSELEGPTDEKLVFQLTGKSSNLFILDGDSRIVASLKKGKGAGQTGGEVYSLPAPPPAGSSGGLVFESGEFPSLSAALDSHYRRKEKQERLESLFRARSAEITRELKKRERLIASLERDLDNHGDPALWKKYGDLLLAGASVAKRTEAGFQVPDLYEDGETLIEIEADPRMSAAEAATGYFKKHSKSKKAQTSIADRITEVRKERESLKADLSDLKNSFEKGELEEAGPEKSQGRTRSGVKEKNSFPGTRTFRSSDGYEILVGRGSRDNDQLTFRVARSLDTWMHAADYPGSHVVIRNRGKQEVPHRTLLEAARLAAYFSKAKGEAKAAVRYTLRKFVHKPKGTKPGLVSLSEFKTVMVEPGIPDELR